MQLRYFLLTKENVYQEKVTLLSKCFVIHWRKNKYVFQKKSFWSAIFSEILEYAIPQKDHIGSNTQIAIQEVDAEENASRPKHRKLKDMTSDERELLEYEDSVKNITKYLGWILISYM